MKLRVLAAVLVLTPALRGGEPDVAALAARIDQAVAAAWDKSVQPAPLADDAEFFRRVHLDLAGRIPSITEIRDFLDDDRPNKRRLWVDRMLQADTDDLSYRDTYASHFANLWRAALLSQSNVQVLFQQADLEHWLRHAFKTNRGYDQLVRELLTQQEVGRNPNSSTIGSVSAFYQANEQKPENLAGATARLFLGVKLECAQCHDHPFASWKREQFWQYAAFFTDLPLLRRPNEPPQASWVRGQIKIGGTDRTVQARFLDGSEPKWKDSNSRPTLADWMTAADNPYFARAAVNRMWAHFFGVPLIEQADGAMEEVPASHRELLDELAQSFAGAKFDLKFLARVITASNTYQRTSASQQDPRLFARMPLRGLTPEQLFDSLAVATEYQDTSGGSPRPLLLGGPQSPREQFLSKFVAQEQKTDYQTSILQALYLMNNEFIGERTNTHKNRTLATLAEQRTSTARKIESLYLVVLSRKPRPAESERFVKYVEAGDAKQTLADVFWALLNSPEFLLNH